MGHPEHPTILFMGRIFEDRWGGVREMAERMLHAAAPLCEKQGRRIEVLVPTRGLCPVEHPAIREVVLPRHAGNRILWDHRSVPAHANRRRGAVLYNIKLVLPVGLRVPGFTSIHDLMYFPQPAKYDWREYYWADSLYMRLMVPRTVALAPFTHVDSAYTAEDARDLFPEIAPHRFRTIPLGVEEVEFTPARWTAEDSDLWAGLGARGVTEPFVFHSGSLSRRKNVGVLATAFREFQRRHPKYRLVLTGGSAPTTGDPRLARALGRLPCGSLVRLGTVSRRELALLYQRAAFFVFPSLYEGFGIPPLEAQAAGCPVICARATSLPEVARDAALYFDPRKPGELLARMEEMQDPAVRGRLRKAGYRNVKDFTWGRMAADWLALADEVYRARRTR